MEQNFERLASKFLPKPPRTGSTSQKGCFGTNKGAKKINEINAFRKTQKAAYDKLVADSEMEAMMTRAKVFAELPMPSPVSASV